VQLLRVVGDSSVDSELPFCAKGTYRGGPVGYLYPQRSFLAAEISLPRVMPYHGPSILPPSGTGKCVSCVARCSFADETIYSRGIVVFKYPLLPRERTFASSFLRSANFFPTFALPSFSLPHVSLSPPPLTSFFLSDFFIPPFRRTCLIHLPPLQLRGRS